MTRLPLSTHSSSSWVLLQHTSKPPAPAICYHGFSIVMEFSKPKTNPSSLKLLLARYLAASRIKISNTKENTKSIQSFAQGNILLHSESLGVWMCMCDLWVYHFVYIFTCMCMCVLWVYHFVYTFICMCVYVYLHPWATFFLVKFPYFRIARKRI